MRPCPAPVRLAVRSGGRQGGDVGLCLSYHQTEVWCWLNRSRELSKNQRNLNISGRFSLAKFAAKSYIILFKSSDSVVHLFINSSPFRGRFFRPGRDRMPIAHRFIGGNTGMKPIPVPEGRSPLSDRKAGCRPSGTDATWMPLNPPINRWAIGIPSLRDNTWLTRIFGSFWCVISKNLPLKATAPLVSIRHHFANALQTAQSWPTLR